MQNLNFKHNGLDIWRTEESSEYLLHHQIPEKKFTYLDQLYDKDLPLLKEYTRLIDETIERNCIQLEEKTKKDLNIRLVYSMTFDIEES